MEEHGELTDEEIQEEIDDLLLIGPSAAGLSLRMREAMGKELFYSVRKLDVLQELLDDKDVTEIMVNGYRQIFYEKGGQVRRWAGAFATRERLEDVIQQICGQCNRIVNEQRPIADARLADGSRVNVVMDPVALDGPILTIRRFPEEPITMEKLIRMGSLTEEAANFLRRLVECRYSILIGGGTSTGKTTFLNALSGYIPGEERLITIEDTAELQIQGIDNLVRLETRNANLEGTMEITIRDLIRTALRMRPDRIVVGEIRGAEAGDFLVALNTGHDGSLGSAHANSVRDMITRMEMMVLMGIELPIAVIRRQIAAGVEFLVHLSRDAAGKRQVEEIAEIVGMDGDDIEIRTIFGRDEAGNLCRAADMVNTEKILNRESHSVFAGESGGSVAAFHCRTLPSTGGSSQWGI